MRRSWICPSLVGLALGACLACPADAARARPACTGRFLLPAMPSSWGNLPPLSVVTLERKGANLSGYCHPAGKARRTKTGWKVKATWKRCGPLRGVVLKGVVDASCSTLQASVRVRLPTLRWTAGAARSVCGDGHVDRGNDEVCDPPGGLRCDTLCQLAPSSCGNHTLDPGEECDDGNIDDSDGCTRACKEAPRCTDALYASTWQAIQALILERHGCTSAVCHGNAAAPTGGLDLTPASAWEHLVGVPSERDPTVQRVTVGDPAASLLYLKVAPGLDSGRFGSPMPLDQPALVADELEALKLWIHAGAPKDGVVPDTAAYLRSCLPPATPQKIDPLPPPAAGEGVQLYAPPWTILPRGEDEVCFATAYDFSSQVPAERRFPCPAEWGGSSRQCFAYTRSDFRQDPNSHHSIIFTYTGTGALSEFGSFACLGGAHDGSACDPTKLGLPAPVGGDCGPRSACAGTAAHLAPGCYPALGSHYGPLDFNTGGGLPDNPTTHAIGGSQTPVSHTSYPAGVYTLLPVRGTMVWDSHAFNLTDAPTTNEQWLNLVFGSDDHRWPVQEVFADDGIFDAFVPPYRQEEVCRTTTFPRGTRVITLSSHTHKHGLRFRVWGPPIQPCFGSSNCDPESSTPLFTTTDYTAPAHVSYDPPLALDEASDASRTVKFCSLYDNGLLDPSTVKRKSTAPLLSLAFCNGIAHTDLSCCADLQCIGPKAGAGCTTNAQCETSPGAGDGVCDACAVYGGVTTADEMLILTGSYYQVPTP